MFMVVSRNVSHILFLERRVLQMFETSALPSLKMYLHVHIEVVPAKPS